MVLRPGVVLELAVPVCVAFQIVLVLFALWYSIGQYLQAMLLQCFRLRQTYDLLKTLVDDRSILRMRQIVAPDDRVL